MEIKATVRTDLLETLQDRLEKKVNKPARKLGLPEATILRDGDPITRPYATGTYESGERYYNEITEEKATKREADGLPVARFEFRPVLVIAEEAKLAGYEFIATIEHTEAGNLLRVQPDHEEALPVEYRTAGNGCDHCGYDRKRKDTYIVRHIATDTFKQVGRSCIKDFLGHGNPELIASYFDNLLRLWTDLVGGFYEDADEGCGGRVVPEFGTTSFLAVVAETVKANGWLSRGKAYEWGGRATADIAWGYLLDCDGSKTPAKLEAEYGFSQVSEESVKIARTVQFWARNLTDSNDNDYLYNLRVACTLDSVRGRRVGIVASAVSAYKRFTAKVAKDEADEERKAKADPVPVTEDRVEVTGKILSTDWRDNGYGAQLKGLIETPAGYRLWGTLPAKLVDDDPKAGDVVEFFARITRSNDDEHFGFWNRPTKAAFIERAPVEAEEVAA